MTLRRCVWCLQMTVLLMLSWFGMQAIHESGHVMAAWASGGRVDRVVLDPLSISRTDLVFNPQPLVVAWGGPLVGTIVPLTVWLLTRVLHLRGRFVLRFFAGFCLVANGVYIGAGVIYPVGDALEIVRLGHPRWLLACFGAVAIVGGFRLWHRLFAHFAFHETPQSTSAADT